MKLLINLWSRFIKTRIYCVFFPLANIVRCLQLYYFDVILELSPTRVAFKNFKNFVVFVKGLFVYLLLNFFFRFWLFPVVIFFLYFCFGAMGVDVTYKDYLFKLFSENFGFYFFVTGSFSSFGFFLSTYFRYFFPPTVVPPTVVPPTVVPPTVVPPTVVPPTVVDTNPFNPAKGQDPNATVINSNLNTFSNNNMKAAISPFQNSTSNFYVNPQKIDAGDINIFIPLSRTVFNEFVPCSVDFIEDLELSEIEIGAEETDYIQITFFKLSGEITKECFGTVTPDFCKTVEKFLVDGTSNSLSGVNKTRFDQIFSLEKNVVDPFMLPPLTSFDQKAVKSRDLVFFDKKTSCYFSPIRPAGSSVVPSETVAQLYKKSTIFNIVDFFKDHILFFYFKQLINLCLDFSIQNSSALRFF